MAQGLLRERRVLREHPPPHPRLKHHRIDRVADGVVQLTGQHRALLGPAVTCILVGGLAGLVLSPMNVADEIGFAGFGSLAVLWMTFAGAGLRSIRHGDVAAHRRWMLRAFAMTYATVMLRLWLVLLVPLTGDFRSGYNFVPFLCWVPNLLVAELILRRSRRRVA